MPDKKILTFVGMPGSGKSICVDYLRAKGLAAVYFGGITLEEVKRHGLEVNEANEKAMREDIRAREGKGAYAHRIIHQIEQLFADGERHIVADGLYSWTEYKIFKEKFGDEAIIIAVVAPRAIRHERLAARPDRTLAEAEASSRDYAEIENLEKGGPIANADYFLNNAGSVEQLTRHLQELLQQLGLDYLI
jgi:dephospho-CoA kinase